MTEIIRPVDVICVLGRGTQLVPVRNAKTGNISSIWRPTQLIETPSVIDGRSHTGFQNRSANPEDDTSLIAGANANTIAAVELYRQLLLAGHQSPSRIIFAAGRPDYLRAIDPNGNRSEGTAMLDKFNKKCRLASLSPLQALILNANKNTRDDIGETLKLMKLLGLNRMALITVEVHSKRAEMFAEMERSSDTDIEIQAYTAESLLHQRYGERWLSLYDKIQGSRAWNRTEANEARGREALLSGSYQTLQTR